MSSKGYREKIRTTGDKVVSTIKELIREGNVRHVVVKDDDGKTLIEFPVSIGVAGALIAPFWAGVAAIATVVTNCTIEVERTDEGEAAEGEEAEATAGEDEIEEAEVVEAEVAE